MNSPDQIVGFFYQQWVVYSVLSVLVSLGLFFLTKKMSLGFLDPINFYWTFTFGTSYAVVLLLFVNGFLSFLSFFIILFYFILLLISMWVGFLAKRVKLGFRTLEISGGINSLRNILFVFIIMYFFLTVFYVSKVDWSVFFISRFEANKGIGFVVRIMDVLRLFIIAIFSILIFSKETNNKFKWLFLIVFVFLSSFFTGAKSAILESVYLIVVVYCLFFKKTLKLKITNLIQYAVLGSGVLMTALFFTSQLAGKLNYESQYTDLNPAVEMFISRVIANGDMYYLGLMDDVIFKVSEQTSGLFELVFRPYLGEDLTTKIFSSGAESSSINVGRAIWEYWFPFSLSGGSTDHFDLAAYAYCGFIGGCFFVIFLGFFLGRMNKIKLQMIASKDKNFFIIIFFSIVYMKSYLMLLSPVVALTTLIDIVFVFILCNFLLLMIKK
ncbi:O-antigen polymerase [Acinetobacter sp. VNK23]|uniref:O-antigen polymerase n=1 Tax=Acinetobacter thutiue TaxID=2998078 RepID=UPI002576C2DA|nr:O-antigen polymerase [Acinetobacter thutiue]MDM1021929.1 O-antigen polymerase [Acinetobacter thutiue]